MSLPILSIRRNNNSTWTFAWANQGQGFSRIVLWGNQLSTTTGFTYTWNRVEYAKFPPPLEIAFENQPVLSEQFQPFIYIQWYGEQIPNGSYNIQQSQDGGNTWRTIKTLTDVGSWLYTYKTVILKDQTTYLYQVIAVDQFGNQSLPRYYQVYMVTPPVPPDGGIVVSYNKPNIVITAGTP